MLVAFDEKWSYQINDVERALLLKWPTSFRIQARPLISVYQ